ncbi:MAG: hypothetical protein KDF56_10025, partial [Ottowia sp.]|nr:hypothetical protein [Ottowia sp.]
MPAAPQGSPRWPDTGWKCSKNNSYWRRISGGKGLILRFTDALAQRQQNGHEFGGGAEHRVVPGGQGDHAGAGQPGAAPEAGVAHALADGVDGGQLGIGAIDEGARHAGHPRRVEVQRVLVGVAGVRRLPAPDPFVGIALQAEDRRIGRRKAEVGAGLCGAEALLARGLGTRASLGYPGDKYEVGLEAIEQIEVMAAELAAEVFGARYAEVRVASGALSNLYVFMATCKAGDTLIAPPPDIGGHVTHHQAGAAGWFGLYTVNAPIDAARYSIDVDALRRLAHDVKPRLITTGGSLNLFEHPVADLRAIADEVGATLMFDAAHLSGMFAGRAWKNPLDEGAHVMTMS